MLVCSLESFVIENRVDQVYPQAGPAARVAGNFVFDEVPAQAQHLVVTAILVRFVPRQELAVGIQHWSVPGQLRADVLLARQRTARACRERPRPRGSEG